MYEALEGPSEGIRVYLWMLTSHSVCSRVVTIPVAGMVYMPEGQGGMILMPEKGIPDPSTLSKKHLKPSIPLLPLVQVPAGSSDRLYTCRVSELPIPWTFTMSSC